MFCVARVLAGLLCALAATGAAASSDPFVDLLAPGGAAIGFTWRYERSVYRGAETSPDRLPLYLYEGERAYLHGTRVGLKWKADGWRFDAFLRYRFEGYTRDLRPASTVGIEPPHEPGIDAGVSLRRPMPWGTPYVELLGDASHRSKGTELRLGYWNEWRRGRLQLRPHVGVSLRDQSLNNYYYGVPGVYTAGAGVDWQAALYGAYAITESWSLLGGLTGTLRSSEITESPIARDGLQTEVFLGVLYDFTPKEKRWAPESRPLIVKVLYGYSSDCDMLQVVRLSCTTTHTVDDTDVAAVHVGRKLIERAGGWPVDVAGFVGVQRHFEKGFQDDFFSFMAFFKAYFYGFPWDRYVRTRLGFGAGLSYAEYIPLMEQRDQAKHDRGTWKMLNYLDPSIDFGIARDVYLGLGVSHRSGAFGRSQIFGNVNGGSNYIYVSVETTF